MNNDEMPSTPSIVVAVVEDTEPVLDSIKLVLENQCWNVLAYTTGEDFLSDLDQQNPDCLLLDTHLPGMDGVEVIYTLHAIGKALPFLVLTAHPTSNETIAFNSFDPFKILTKPVTEDVLISSVIEMSGGRASP